MWYNPGEALDRSWLMTHTLTVTLSEPVYAALKRAADAAAREPAAEAADALAARYAAAARPRTDTRRLFGSIVRLDPPSLDNEQIDADLAREYGDSHEEL